MAKLEYKDSWVQFRDCIEGMKSLEDKSVDLCLTDPPYGRNYKGSLQRYKDTHKNLAYDDSCIPEGWFEEARRVSKLLIFSPGNPSLKYYFDKEEPIDWFIHYKRNGHGSTYLTWMNQREIYLCYGKYWDWKFDEKPFRFNVFNIPLTAGFLKTKDDIYLHPTPKPLKLWKHLIQSLNPSSVLDPFMGSGTTLEACIQLGIPCYGYELMEEYRADMEKRIEQSKYYRRPVKLDKWLEVDENNLQKEMGSNLIL